MQRLGILQLRTWQLEMLEYVKVVYDSVNSTTDIAHPILQDRDGTAYKNPQSCAEMKVLNSV